MLRTNTVIMPNFVSVGQTVYENSVTKNRFRESKLNIPTILPYGGIIAKDSVFFMKHSVCVSVFVIVDR